ncbi:hypothetical protein Tco_1024015 [Tanacetum coccineum]
MTTVYEGTRQVEEPQRKPDTTRQAKPTKLVEGQGYEGANSEGAKLNQTTLKSRIRLDYEEFSVERRGGCEGRKMPYQNAWGEDTRGKKKRKGPKNTQCMRKGGFDEREYLPTPMTLEGNVTLNQGNERAIGMVRRIYVDGGSSSEVMYEHFFRNLGPDTKAKLRESRVLLVGFSGEVNYLLGMIDLSVTIGEQDRIRTVMIEFMAVKWHSLYNVILGRTGMRSLRVVASTIYSMIRFLTANEISTMVTNIEALRECQKIEEAQGSILEGRITHPRIRATTPYMASGEGKMCTPEEDPTM